MIFVIILLSVHAISSVVDTHQVENINHIQNNGSTINLETDKLFSCFTNEDLTDPTKGTKIVTLVIPNSRMEDASKCFMVRSMFEEMSTDNFIRYHSLTTGRFSGYNILPYLSGIPLNIESEFIGRANEYSNISSVRLPIKVIPVEINNNKTNVVDTRDERYVDIRIGQDSFQLSYHQDVLYSAFTTFHFTSGNETFKRNLQCTEIEISQLVKGDVVVGKYPTTPFRFNIADTENTRSNKKLDMVSVYMCVAEQMERLDIEYAHNSYNDPLI